MSTKRGVVASALTTSPPCGLADRRIVGHAGKHLGDVANLHGAALALHLARNVHQASQVARKQRVGAARRDIGALPADDGVGQFAVLDCECPAEAAAHISVVQRNETQPFDARQQFARLAHNPHLAQAGARIVIGDGALETGGDLGDAEPVDEEAHHFVAFSGKGVGLDRHVRLIGEELGIVPGEHPGAGAARRDDAIAGGEGLDRPPGDRLGRGAVARVVGGLAAAGLRGNDDFAARLLQQLDRGEADARTHEVDEAGDEKPDAERRRGRRGGGVSQDQRPSFPFRRDIGPAGRGIQAKP